MKGLGLRAKGSILVLLLLAATFAAAETIDRVLAVVAGQLIMLSDVNAVRELGIVNVRPDSPDPTAEVLARLIDRELMLVAERSRDGVHGLHIIAHKRPWQCLYRKPEPQRHKAFLLILMSFRLFTFLFTKRASHFHFL